MHYQSETRRLELRISSDQSQDFLQYDTLWFLAAPVNIWYLDFEFRFHRSYRNERYGFQTRPSELSASRSVKTPVDTDIIY